MIDKISQTARPGRLWWSWVPRYYSPSRCISLLSQRSLKMYTKPICGD